MEGPVAAVLDNEARGRGEAIGLAGSALLHAGLLAAVLTLTPARSFIAPEPPAISVDLVAPDVDEPPVAALPAPSPPDAPAAADDGSFHATTLYTARLLGEPQMAQVARALKGVAPGERVVQLCNIEALEQIRRAAPQYEPDTLVSYAFSDPVAAGLMLTALGGAFRSRRQWYAISFECTASADLLGVTSFAFKLGELIPETEWEAHNLNAEDKVE